MKAKELAELLMQNPEAEVVYPDYDTVNKVIIIDEASYKNKGNSTEEWGDTDSNELSENGIYTKDVIVLY